MKQSYHVESPTPSSAPLDAGVLIALIQNSGAELALTLAGGLDEWSNQTANVVTNAVCALFLMSRAPPVARERLKEGGKVTQFLANLSKRGTEVQKKVNSQFVWPVQLTVDGLSPCVPPSVCLSAQLSFCPLHFRVCLCVFVCVCIHHTPTCIYNNPKWV